MAANQLGPKKAAIQNPQSKQRFFFPLRIISIKLLVFITDGSVFCFRQDLDLCILTLEEYYLLKFCPQPNFTKRTCGQWVWTFIAINFLTPRNKCSVSLPTHLLFLVFVRLYSVSNAHYSPYPVLHNQIAQCIRNVFRVLLHVISGMSHKELRHIQLCIKASYWYTVYSRI